MVIDDSPSSRRPVSKASILFVCTANRCRSPMAAAFFARHATELGAEVDVHSAGSLERGAPALPETVDIMAKDYGIDLAGHRSRKLDGDLVTHCDLIVGLERSHVRLVVLAAPDQDAWNRTFTLRELVRRGREVGARPPDASLAGWLGELQRSRRRSALLGSSPLDDVADPVGGGPMAIRAAATVIADLVEELVELLSLASFQNRRR